MDEAANFVIPAHLTLIEIGKMFLKSCHPNFWVCIMQMAIIYISEFSGSISRTFVMLRYI